MLGVALGYIGALLLDWPLGPIALAGAAMVLRAGRVGPREAAGRIGWSTFALLAGMFALLDAVARGGLIEWALSVLHAAARFGPFPVIAAAGAGSALLANLLNNLPVAAISGSIVAHGQASALAYSLIAGIDLGPNLTTTGSLATILWLTILRERGVEVSALEYVRLGVSVVPAMLLVTGLWLWLVR
jgi:arsenical pump membrane protein